MNKDNIEIRRPDRSWSEGMARTITFVVTEDCQLKCKYCYVVGKNKYKKMNVEIAKKVVDYLLSERNIFDENSLIVDFIGGEPFLEIDLIDIVSDYIKLKLFELDHPWFSSYRFSFSTNGILYSDERIQRYIEKNKAHISIGITIDGTKKKHDINRIYPDGSGSYDDVVKNIPLWLEQFPTASTKVTVASEDLPYIKDSVIHLWTLGITGININVVFENVWKEGDDEIFYNQLVELADYTIEHELYKENYCSFFSESIGNPMPITDTQNWCGSGYKMLAVDCDGNFYPCNRFLPFTLEKKKKGRGRCIGNYIDGIDFNKLRPFQTLDRLSQSTEECIDCEVASGCALCVGLNYDDADTHTIFQRAAHICKMHKARVKANNYYWNKLEKEKGYKRKTNYRKVLNV